MRPFPHVPAVLLVLLVAADVGAQSRTHPPPRPAAAPLPPVTRGRKLITIESHRSRTSVDLTGRLDGPVAIDAHGHAVFLADDGVATQLAADGNVRWSFLAGPPGGAPALGPDGAVYLAGRDGRLYALDDDGGVRWWGALGGRPVRGVAIGSDRVAVALDTGVLALWKLDGSGARRVRLGETPSAAPIVLGRGRIAVPLRDGRVVVVAETDTGWRSRHTRVGTGAVGPLAGTRDGEIVAGTLDGTVARVRADGSLAWRVDAGGPVRLSPVFDEDGTTFVAVGPAVVAIAPTGKVMWRRGLSGPVVAGPLVAGDGAIYVALAVGDRGQVRALAGDGTERRIDLPAPPTRGLALDSGRLWVGLENGTLQQVAVPQRGLARSSWPKARRDGGNTGSF